MEGDYTVALCGPSSSKPKVNVELIETDMRFLLAFYISLNATALLYNPDLVNPPFLNTCILLENALSGHNIGITKFSKVSSMEINAYNRFIFTELGHFTGKVKLGMIERSTGISVVSWLSQSEVNQFFKSNFPYQWDILSKAQGSEEKLLRSYKLAHNTLTVEWLENRRIKQTVDEVLVHRSRPITFEYRDPLTIECIPESNQKVPRESDVILQNPISPRPTNLYSPTRLSITFTGD